MRPGQEDWRGLIDAKDREIERLNGIYVSMLKKAGVELFTGDARFVDANTVEIGPSELAPDADVQTVRAKNIVIATGGAPTRLDIPGAEHAIVSDDAFHLENRPERVAIIGSGYIGIEFAGIFAGLGSQVDFVYRQDLPLRGFDEEMRRHIAELVPLNGITSHPGSTPERIEKTSEGYNLHLKGGKVIETDCVFMATGRHPNLTSLRLDLAGVEVTDGRIVTRLEDAKTNVPGIYAIGDVTATYNLTPTAIDEGHLLADRLFGETGREWSFGTTPKAVFFSQPLPAVGLTEQEAAEHHTPEIYTSSFTQKRQSLSGRKGNSYMPPVLEIC